MIGWVPILRRQLEAGHTVVLVTVVEAMGSTPRGTGTKMIVGRDEIVGTVGGGHLEFKALQLARTMLMNSGVPPIQVHEFPLGPSLGQCCGGHATLLLESIDEANAGWLEALDAIEAENNEWIVITRTDTGEKLVIGDGQEHGSLGDNLLDRKATALATHKKSPASGLESVGVGGDGEDVRLFIDLSNGSETLDIFLYGAGHVGKAIVQVLSPLPGCRIRWIDSRLSEFPRHTPPNVEVRHSESPADDVDEQMSGAYALVMTHSHALDYDIVERILKRGDFRYCGLIGSQTKRARFIKRLAHRGVPSEMIQRLTCPIGIDTVTGKHPAEIAIGVAAEILQIHDQRSTVTTVEELTA